MNEGISAENESSNRPKRAPLDEENHQIAEPLFSAQRPARDRALTRIPDSPPRRAALCAESMESGLLWMRPEARLERRCQRNRLAWVYTDHPG
jgi:hypothetical protein